MSVERVAALVVGLVAFVVHAWLALGGYFGQDDFVLTYRAAGPLDLEYLFQDYSGHLQPGVFLYAWVVTAVAPLSFPVAMGPLLVVHGLVLWLCWRTLVRLFGHRWGVVVAFAVFACSPLVLFPTLWWAYALQLLPVLLALFGALLAQPRNPWLAVPWVAFGLLFYEKAALIPAVLLAVAILTAPSDTPILWALRRYRWVWLGHLAVLAAFAVLYVSLADAPANENPVGSRDVLTFVYRSVVDTLLPGLLGGPLTEPGGGATWVTPPAAVRVGTGVAAVALVVLSFLRSGRRALLPWLFLAGYLAADLTIVAVTRLGVVGPVVASDPRYLADVVPVAVLCAAFAFLAPRREPAGTRTRVAVGALTVLVVAGGVASFVRVAPALQFQDAREYVATARSALAGRPDLVLYDTAVPNQVIIDWFVNDAFTSRVVGLVPERPRFDRPTEDLHQLDGTGTPRPIIDLVDTTVALPGPRPDCGYLIGTDTVRIPLEDTVTGRRIVRIGYYTGDSGDGTVRVGDTAVPVRFAEGLHVLHVVATGTYTHVEVSRPLRLRPICVTDVTVGVPG
ncbi:hypothetical protein [Actinophytocola gossypii]|uniref:DUF2029 domain-containing protein n=1 Tax=Actinophytocola gossypii TaxID=2812003 RepID=A0ABT2J683_9PSEU|nr:hypothetical protein [Actinophytocola gossypii]MCT2582774.1 hypothetical protein [Actinophytocola gossypii]